MPAEHKNVSIMVANYAKVLFIFSSIAGTSRSEHLFKEVNASKNTVLTHTKSKKKKSPKMYPIFLSSLFVSVGKIMPRYFV